MCGIVGWAFDRNLTSFGDIDEATDMLHRRGPDARGTWLSDSGAVALGHRRLAVLDPSPSGAQPMSSFDGRYLITFNGEIYNHLQLRTRLERSNAAPPRGWRSTSDTETLLCAIGAWGIEAALSEVQGMFALGVWDSDQETLTLARDRFGEKPLYVARIGGGIAFASELKALTRLPGFNKSIDSNALGDLLTLGYIRSPASIYEGTCKMLPGSYVTLTASTAAALPADGDFLATVRHQYWSLIDLVVRGQNEPFRGALDEAVDELDSLLTNAVRGQQIADVPLGAFLSGGIDSTSVVALMQAATSGKVRTFTIGFDESGYDESSYAERVAHHLGTEHTTVIMSPDEALNRVALLPNIWDEPFADISQLPTLLVADVTRRSVTVALSGDGGDELFGGYARYGWMARNWPRVTKVPLPIRQGVSKMVGLVPTETWNSILGYMPGRVGRYSGWRLQDAATLISSATIADFYQTYMSSWKLGAHRIHAGSKRALHWSGYPQLRSTVESLMYYDSVDYMPDDVLVKVDRAAMSVSLETRAPFLDAKVAEFAWKLPLPMKRDGDEGKKVLRRLVQRYVPADLIDRPKAGFSVPLDDWLRGPMRDWADDLLDPVSLQQAGLISKPIRAAWKAHVERRANHRYFLWNVLTYQAWRRVNLP